MVKNTEIARQLALKYFLEFNNLSRIEELKNKKPEEIYKIIDNTFETSDYSPASVLQKVSLIRNYLEYNFDIILPKSKIRKELSKKILRQTNKEAITKDEIKIMDKYLVSEYKKAVLQIEKIRTFRNIILFRFLAGTGQRINDIINIKVNNAKINYIFFKQEKTGTEISIENPCQTEINRYVLSLHLNEDDFLFSNGLLRKPLSSSQAFKIIKELGLKTIHKEISPHCFRAYVIKELKSLNYSNKQIKSISGHSSEAMIEYYDKGKAEIGNTKDLLLL